MSICTQCVSNSIYVFPQCSFVITLPLIKFFFIQYPLVIQNLLTRTLFTARIFYQFNICLQWTVCAKHLFVIQCLFTLSICLYSVSVYTQYLFAVRYLFPIRYLFAVQYLFVLFLFAPSICLDSIPVISQAQMESIPGTKRKETGWKEKSFTGQPAMEHPHKRYSYKVKWVASQNKGCNWYSLCFVELFMFTHIVFIFVTMNSVHEEKVDMCT